MKKNLIIIGAGVAAKIVANDILFNKNLNLKYNLHGFLDDDENKKTVLERPVFGKISLSKEIIKKYSIDEVIIAIPSASKEEINKIISYLEGEKIKIKIVPGMYEIISGDFSFSQVRRINPIDLLGREEVGFDIDVVAPFYEGKNIFITGAGGSIGSEIVNELFKLPVGRIIAFGHGENSIHSLISKYNDKRFSYVIGDVRDYEKLNNEIKKFDVDIIFHAAAHKHVPLMEDFPDEAIKNNVFGSVNVAKCAIENGVKDFIFVSTDKAVEPTSVMGASKRLSELLLLSFNEYQNSTRFRITRFGNVLGSRGSVIPLFEEQIKRGGPVTVTHREMVRYFMSISEASRLVIKSPCVEDGNLFVLDMGEAINIYEFAKKMIKLYGHSENEIPIVITGIRPGEKLYEKPLSQNESLIKTKFDKLLVSNIKEPPLQIDNVIGEFQKVINEFGDIRKLLKKYVTDYFYN